MAMLPGPCRLICGEEADLASLWGSGMGDLRGAAGWGVTERDKVDGRPVIIEEAPFAQLLTKRKL